jgi:hypothetical protein
MKCMEDSTMNCHLLLLSLSLVPGWFGREGGAVYLSSANETTPGTALSPCVADTYARGAPQWHFGPTAGYNASQIVDRPSVKPWRR